MWYDWRIQEALGADQCVLGIKPNIRLCVPAREIGLLIALTSDTWLAAVRRTRHTRLSMSLFPLASSLLPKRTRYSRNSSRVATDLQRWGLQSYRQRSCRRKITKIGWCTLTSDLQ